MQSCIISRMRRFRMLEPSQPLSRLSTLVSSNFAKVRLMAMMDPLDDCGYFGDVNLTINYYHSRLWIVHGRPDTSDERRKATSDLLKDRLLSKTSHSHLNLAPHRIQQTRRKKTCCWFSNILIPSLNRHHICRKGQNRRTGQDICPARSAGLDDGQECQELGPKVVACPRDASRALVYGRGSCICRCNGKHLSLCLFLVCVGCKIRWDDRVIVNVYFSVCFVCVCVCIYIYMFSTRSSWRMICVCFPITISQMARRSLSSTRQSRDLPGHTCIMITIKDDKVSIVSKVWGRILSLVVVNEVAFCFSKWIQKHGKGSW